MNKYPLTNKGAKYTRDMVSDKSDGCLQVKQACQRQINNLKKQKNSSYPYKFDKEKAERACAFIEMLPHQKGKWRGSPIRLEPWQCFIVSCIFGWIKKKDGKRRFTEAVIVVPRKNGKSLLAAGIALYLGFVDGEPGAEIYCAATTEKQAFEVHRPMWRICKMLPAFTEKFGVELSGTDVNPGSIYSLESGSRCNVVVGNPPDGSLPAAWIQDEYHESKDSRSYDTGVTGMGSREQPLMLVTSTAGTNTTYPFYELVLRVRRTLAGKEVNEDVFGIEYTMDKDADWTDFKNWEIANPNCGVSVSKEFLQKQLKNALQSTRKQNILKCKHLNIWSNAGSPWLNANDWAKCEDSTLDINDFLGETCYPGCDLASKKDIASKMRLFKRGDIYYLFSKHWTTTDRIEGPEQTHYVDWVESGYLTAHQGARIDIEEIEKSLIADAKLFDLTGSENGGGEVCIDPWNAQQLATNLLNQGIEVVEIPQTAPSLSEPMKELEVLIMEGKFKHDGNPVTTWMFENVICEPDHKENIFPRKENKNSPNKIDGAVATINAMARAMYDPGTTQCQGNDGSLI